MSTYNGSQFLKDQLDSIFGQKDVEVHLLIRDDGSTDDTLKIIREYQTRFPDKITVTGGRNLGWRESFFSLVREAYLHFAESYDYFSFSDQDDIWLPEKLSHAVKTIGNGSESPSLYCSNLILYEEGKPTGLLRKNKIIPSVKGSLIRNYATGCTILFNRAMLRLIGSKIPTIKVAHDHWFYMVANLCGNVTVDDEAFILYRQHNNNQIGNKSGFLEIWERRLKSVSNLLGARERESTTTELLRLHHGDMTQEGLEAVSLIRDYRKSIKKRLSLLRDKAYTFNKSSSDFWLRLRIILGKL